MQDIGFKQMDWIIELDRIGSWSSCREQGAEIRLTIMIERKRSPLWWQDTKVVPSSRLAETHLAESFALMLRWSIRSAVET